MMIKYHLKAGILFLILLFSILAQCRFSIAQFEATGAFAGNPSFENKPFQVPSWQYPENAEGALLIDNFEYFDSPYNHGWKQLESSFPVFGFGIGYHTVLRTVLDLREGSRVLDTFRESSIFLLGSSYETHTIYYELFTPSVNGVSSSISFIDLNKRPVLSFKFFAPFRFEPWETFEFDVICSTDKGYEAILKIIPLQPIYSSSMDCDYHSTVTEWQNSPHRPSMTVRIDIGKNFMDGTWHAIWLNLPEMVRIAVDRYKHIGDSQKSYWYITKAKKIMIRGQMFRLDNIIFRERDYSRYSRSIQVDVFEMGPLYAQIFEPYRYLLMADYRADHDISSVNDFLLDPNNFILDPNEIRNVWISDLLKFDPNYHIIDKNHPLYNPAYTNRWMPGDPNFGKSDKIEKIYMRDDFFIDMTLPIFREEGLRIGGDSSVTLRNHGRLGWNSSINGFGPNAIQSFLVKPLPIDPYDGIPTYIMNRLSALKTIEKFGKSHFGPNQCMALESALWNAGMEFWPHIAYFDYLPQYFEDLIISLEIRNQNKVEKLAFPISVVNYPVENHPPKVQSRIFPRVFDVGEETECILLSLDPDCFIFSLAQFQGKAPATTHVPMLPDNRIRTDQDSLLYQMHIEGIHAYQYGPWIECSFDTFTGIGRLTPKFEGILRTIIVCTDVYGASDAGRRNIHCVNPGTWFNHPPIVTALPNPRVIRVGEEIIMNARAEDPDGDEVYATCNIGSIGQVASGDTIWTFQTNFPGIYHLEIIFFDIRGGYASASTSIEVVPWWSY